MGNKSNPLYIRTGFNKNVWPSFWSHSKNLQNYHCLLLEDLYIQKIISFYFKRLDFMIQKITIYRSKQTIFIKLEAVSPHYFSPNYYKYIKLLLKLFLKKNIKIKKIKFVYFHIYQLYRLSFKNQSINYKRLKRLSVHLRYFKYNIRLINIINYVIWYRNSQMLIDYLAYIFKEAPNRKHFRIISAFKKLLRIIYSEFKLGKHTFKGIKCCIKGRINGRNRKRSIWIKLGVCSLSSFMTNIDYKTATFINKDGIFNIKFWIFQF